MTSPLTGTVLRIEKTSIHDGAGLRTVVFLKGCPLACRWCSTPEGQRRMVDIGLATQLCDGCGICVDACPESCFSIDDDGTCSLDRERCTYCLDCIESCPQGAVKAYGQNMTVSEVLEQISRDEIFYFFSGGGVTISGGECLTQADFVAAILEECRARGIDTALETSLFSPWDEVLKVLPHVNSLYVDIKHSDSRTHQELTGVGTELIWENLERIDEMDRKLPIIIRIPLIPGLNDSDANLQTTLKKVSGLKQVQCIDLLPYHRLGVSTYESLGKKYTLKSLQAPAPDYMAERTNFLRGQKTTIPIKISG